MTIASLVMVVLVLVLWNRSKRHGDSLVRQIGSSSVTYFESSGGYCYLASGDFFLRSKVASGIRLNQTPLHLSKWPLYDDESGLLRTDENSGDIDGADMHYGMVGIPYSYALALTLMPQALVWAISCVLCVQRSVRLAIRQKRAGKCVSCGYDLRASLIGARNVDSY